MSLIRIPSEFCHTFKSVCEHFIKEGGDQNLYDYVTSLRGCDCNIDQKEYMIVKTLATSVLRGHNDETGGMDITSTIELFSEKEVCDYKANSEMCKDALEYCSKKSGHYMLHVAWGFRALGIYYEMVAEDRLYDGDGVEFKLQNVALNCKSISNELQGLRDLKGEHIVNDIYELVTDITVDTKDDEFKRVRWISSEKFKKFME